MKYAPFALLLALSTAHAAPPPGVEVNPERHAWFEQQHSVSGAWCCNLSDGHILNDNEWRQSGDHYQVLINGIWYEVPAHAMRDPKDGPNITGSAVVWYLPIADTVTIYCFAPGFEY